MWYSTFKTPGTSHRFVSVNPGNRVIGFIQNTKTGVKTCKAHYDMYKDGPVKGAKCVKGENIQWLLRTEKRRETVAKKKGLSGTRRRRRR